MSAAIVVWEYRDGSRESFTCFCIRDARELWDKLDAAGTNLLSPRP